MTYDKFKNIINKKPSELKYETLDLEIIPSVKFKNVKF